MTSLSCKKGEEDPFLSLITRKNRLTGNWTFSGSDGQRIYTNSENINWSVSGNEDSINSKYYPYPSLDRTDEIIDYSIVFFKEGNWIDVRHVNVRTEKIDYNTKFINEWTEYQLRSGKWTFLNSTDGLYKNKERVLIEILSDSLYQSSNKWTAVPLDNPDSTTVSIGPEFIDEFEYGQGVNTFTIELVELRNNEMKWRLDNDFGYNHIVDTTVWGAEYMEEVFLRWRKN